MKKFLSVLFAVMLLGNSSAYALGPKVANEMRKVVKLAISVTLPEKDKDGKPIQGEIDASGVPITDSLILTAGHFCASGADFVQKGWSDGNVKVVFMDEFGDYREMDGGQIVKFQFDPLQDLCLIQREHHGLPIVRFEKRPLVFGQDVYAVGYPLGYMIDITDGHVCNPSIGDVSIEGLYEKVLISTAVTQGNSGGVIFNKRGKVVGITVMVHPMYHHLSWAIDVAHIREFLVNGE